MVLCPPLVLGASRNDHKPRKVQHCDIFAPCVPPSVLGASRNDHKSREAQHCDRFLLSPPLFQIRIVI